MTAPQPATPGSDSVREQIAEVLRGSYALYFAGGPTAVADVLVPLVDRLRAEAKAEVWTLAASWVGPPFAAEFRDRAAAYRTNPSSEESQR